MPVGHSHQGLQRIVFYLTFATPEWKAHTHQCKPQTRESTLNTHEGKACYHAALLTCEENESATHPFNPDTNESIMHKYTFIPAVNHDFLIWIDHFIANLTPDYGTSDSDLDALKAASAL